MFIMSQVALMATLFPYTTLFRSLPMPPLRGDHWPRPRKSRAVRLALSPRGSCRRRSRVCCTAGDRRPWAPVDTSRSEEHTSELQSRFDLVCGLLLEKKKLNVNDG